jgi:hypothetical protein
VWTTVVRPAPPTWRGRQNIARTPVGNQRLQRPAKSGCRAKSFAHDGLAFAENPWQLVTLVVLQFPIG